MSTALARYQRGGSSEKVLQPPTERLNTPMLIMQVMRKMRELMPSIVYPMVRQRIGPQSHAVALSQKHIAVERHDQLMLAHLVLFVDDQGMLWRDDYSSLQRPGQDCQLSGLRKLQVEIGAG